MNYMRLLKLLYIADRESLKETGRPITGDKVVAMKRGPVLSRVLNLIKDKHTQSPYWERYIQKEFYHISLAKDPGVSQLSPFEVETLNRVAEKYVTFDETDMVDETHTFPEWIKNQAGDSSAPIPLEDILEAVGRSGDTKSILQDAKDDAAYDRVFGSLS